MIRFDRIWTRPITVSSAVQPARMRCPERVRKRVQQLTIKDGRERPNAAHDAERVVNPVEKR